MNWLPELCSQSSVQWMTRKAASQITGVLTCHEAAQQFRSQLTLISASLVGAGITQELLLHHYSLANDAVKAMLFGEAEEQQLVRTRIEAAEARRQAAIGQEQLQAEQQLAQARAQIQAQAQAPVVVAPPIVAPVSYTHLTLPTICSV